ncbi:hypothetical protein [Kutzneria sp. NPDC051319]|uniref:hypothetical protein n=1 Tax=Kutzneria sp. NPDC051319 TaxID=3155047 RepID=UPI003425B7E8
MLLRWLLGVAAQVPAQRRAAPLAPPAARPAERLVYDVAGGAACATLPKIELAALRWRPRVVLTVHTDRGPLVIGDTPTQTTGPAAAGGPPVIGGDELVPPAAELPARPSLAGHQFGRVTARRRVHRWVSVAVLAVGVLWVADTFDDQPADGRYGVAEDVRMEAVTVVTHAPPQTWPRITTY